jgi:hypothetical protein
MITSIISLILTIPKFLEIAERFASWLNETLTTIRKKQLEKEFGKASVIAKEKKDTSKLDAMFDSRKK